MSLFCLCFFFLSLSTLIIFLKPPAKFMFEKVSECFENVHFFCFKGGKKGALQQKSSTHLYDTFLFLRFSTLLDVCPANKYHKLDQLDKLIKSTSKRRTKNMSKRFDEGECTSFLKKSKSDQNT